MDLRQLRYFLAVVDEGGFTRAARACRVAQPSLSQSIKLLERDVGIPLFQRVGRGVVLTAAGRALEQPARQVLRDVATARASVDAVSGLAGGHLDIAVVPTLAADPVTLDIARFRASYPGVVVRLKGAGDERRVVSMIVAGACELGVIELPTSTSDLVVHRIARHELVAVCVEALWKRPERRARMADLSDLPLVMTPAGTSTRDLIDRAFIDAGCTPTIGVETTEREALVPLVRTGAGAAFLPRTTAVQILDDATVIIELDPVLERHVGLIHRNGPLSPAAAEFVSVAVDVARAEDGEQGDTDVPDPDS